MRHRVAIAVCGRGVLCNSTVPRRIYTSHPWIIVLLIGKDPEVVLLIGRSSEFVLLIGRGSEAVFFFQGLHETLISHLR
ncbi:hypothetical protein NPIL_654671 [Nephila pilipes]|uniref:Uncharacterized protein n=1 Tax=Nephila pilipes TaxID=299642 RepID=A0A8X6PE31_NEPPI|nr:hypothetical protein NPIL_654671 [Nephila pilipes]